jgi:predicted nucleic acid-binding protein
MPGNNPKRSYWDSSVFLAWINGEEDRADIVSGLFESARRGEITVVTSVLTITEVAYATAETASATLSAEVLGRIDALWDPPSPVRLAEFHRLIAANARNLMRLALPDGRRLKPPDAIHMSTAVRTQCQEILTYDPKWAAYAGTLGVRIDKPMSAVIPLPFEGTVSIPPVGA